jgi:hypothetical protein
MTPIQVKKKKLKKKKKLMKKKYMKKKKMKKKKTTMILHKQTKQQNQDESLTHRQAHHNMAEVTYGLPDRKYPPSDAVARALFQPPKPDDLPHPNFDNDNASIPPDASPRASPEPETLDTATTTDEPYSWKGIPRVSGMSRIARELTTSYNPAPLASTSPTISDASKDSASTSPSEEAELAIEDCCVPLLLVFLKSLYTPRLYVLLLIPLIILIGGKLYALSLRIVKINTSGLLFKNPMYRKEGR